MKSFLDKFDPNPYRKRPAPKDIAKKLRIDPHYTYWTLSGPGLRGMDAILGTSGQIDTLIAISTATYNEGVAIGIKLGMEIYARHIKESPNGGEERSTRATKGTVEPKRKSIPKKTRLPRGRH